MKRWLILIVGLIFWGGMKGQANVYHPFPDSNAVWIGQFQNSTGQLYQTDEDYYLNGDTVINSTVYSKLYKNYHEVEIDNYLQVIYDFGIILGEYAGGIRNDTTQRKIFYCASNQECLLYNFSLQVGDSINTSQYCGTTSAPHAYVESIDSIFIGNNYRKRFNIHNDLSPVSYIEGIGSDNGLLMGMDYFETSSSLYCFYQNDSLKYSSGCDFVGIEDVRNSSTIKIYPNPSNNQITIKGKRINTYILSNTVGQVIKEGKQNGDETTIEVSALPNGIYILGLDGRSFYKISVIH